MIRQSILAGVSDAMAVGHAIKACRTCAGEGTGGGGGGDETSLPVASTGSVLTGVAHCHHDLSMLRMALLMLVWADREPASNSVNRSSPL